MYSRIKLKLCYYLVNAKGEQIQMKKENIKQELKETDKKIMEMAIKMCGLNQTIAIQLFRTHMTIIEEEAKNRYMAIKDEIKEDGSK